ncbi:hypothetical protein [Geofilum rubicundum]|uniref:Uncharacterized protein n=1 Tax=Geofilum rubicundum JCM 15548 TaxID=1236989 RepID=A0A0E9LUC3_9BACT|nr:hypothetical protein [Geofilum rubicundum]GAO29187.1 hypothetical protein JCM15548_11352 [Geofilum rubicundum JCM 15548]
MKVKNEKIKFDSNLKVILIITLTLIVMTTFLFKHLLAFCILFISINLYSQTSSGQVFPAISYNPIWFNNGSVGIDTPSPNTTFHVNGITTLGSGNVINPASTSLLRFPATGTAGQQRVYIELQGVHNNDVANENGGGFIKFRTSTAAGYGPEIGGIRRGGGTGDFIIKTGGMNVVERLRVLDNGNVGIGTSNPTEKLDIKGKILATGIEVSGEEALFVTDGIKPLMIRNTIANSYYQFGMAESSGDFHGLAKKGDVILRAATPGGKFLISNLYAENHVNNKNKVIGIVHGGSNGVWVHNNGNIRLGKYNLDMPNERLFVEGNANITGIIYASEIQVKAQTADFVFENDYNLRSLEEVESFILENKHLPEIPSAAQMEAEGTNIAEMNKLLLMKIEELTLYMIEQQKMIHELKEAVSKN